MISILIVDDDINKISSIINSIHRNYKDQIDVKQASTAQEALEELYMTNFDLLITDLMMPIRIDSPPDPKGGESLIKQMYRKKDLKVPMYVVGLTQFDDFEHNFTGVWKVWKFDSSSEEWQNKLRDLIYHISRVESKIIRQKKETIFVEGISDKNILTLAVNLFFPDYKDSLKIDTISSGAGASWVERQLIIWGKTLFWKNRGEGVYLKAVGLFDNDEPGNKAIQNVRDNIVADSAESKTFSIIKLDRKYSRHLIPLYTKGIDIPITLEEMYAPFCWDYAKKHNWLKDRLLFDLSEIIDENLIFAEKKLNEDHKADLVKFINQLEIPEQKLALYAFEPLLYDILIKLKLLQKPR